MTDTKKHMPGWDGPHYNPKTMKVCNLDFAVIDPGEASQFSISAFQRSPDGLTHQGMTQHTYHHIKPASVRRVTRLLQQLAGPMTPPEDGDSRDPGIDFEADLLRAIVAAQAEEIRTKQGHIDRLAEQYNDQVERVAFLQGKLEAMAEVDGQHIAELATRAARWKKKTRHLIDALHEVLEDRRVIQAERDQAREELRGIRKTVGADILESTGDRVSQLMSDKAGLLDRIAELRDRLARARYEAYRATFNDAAPFDADKWYACDEPLGIDTEPQKR